MKKVWSVPVTWEVCGIVKIEAVTLAEAMKIARDNEGNLDIPKESEYVDGSWSLSSDDERYIRLCFNNSQEDS